MTRAMAKAGRTTKVRRMRAIIPRRSALAGGLVTAVCSSALVRAHGAHAAFTIIEENNRAGTLEVIHRLVTLDLELALTARMGRTIVMENEPEPDVLLSAYVNDYFFLTDGKENPIALAWVGSALEIDTVFAYQEAPLPQNLSALIIANQMLTETHPSQINTVNVTFGGRTQTRSFVLGDPPQGVGLV